MKTLSKKLTWLFYITGMGMLLLVLSGMKSLPLLATGFLFMLAAWIIIMIDVSFTPLKNKGFWVYFLIFFSAITMPVYLWFRNYKVNM